MATDHPVKQGEHLTRMAKKYGFSDYRVIWDHARNAELKAERQNPNVLFPASDDTIDKKLDPAKIQSLVRFSGGAFP